LLGLQLFELLFLLSQPGRFLGFDCLDLLGVVEPVVGQGLAER